MKGTIPISTVLFEIKKGAPFTLVFVKQTGAGEGEFKAVKAMYGKAKQPFGGRKNSLRQISIKKEHRYASTIPLIDMATGKPCTPFIYNLTKFNGYIIKH